MMDEPLSEKEKAINTFLDKVARIKPLEPDSLPDFFRYVKDLDRIANQLYESGFIEGFNNAINIDIHKN